MREVVNPFKTGILLGQWVNSALTTAAGAAPWSGCESAHASGVNSVALLLLV
jgi:hypothetical protein